MYRNVEKRLFTLLLMMIVVMTSAVPAFGASDTHITFSGQMLSSNMSVVTCRRS